MSDPKDLTRWNRAGLSRFTYVDGNAVEYLEFLRRELAASFPDTHWISPREPNPPDEEPRPGETVSEEQKRLRLRNERLLHAYFGERRDWAWEISRTFARACHILTGYVEAWANEGYLETATQWDNVRRLVGLLDYYPAPPASATTPLMLLAKKGAVGIVAKGMQVKNAPPKGAEKITFETLDDLLIDEALNELRPKGWNKSPDASGIAPAPFSPTPREFSPMAKGPLAAIQNLGEKRAQAFGHIGAIFQLYDMHPKDLAWTKIGAEWLWEFKAKAMTICDFQPASEWDAIIDWTLPAVAAAPAASVAEITGNSMDQVQEFQSKIALLGACLDRDIYTRAKLADFRSSTTSASSPYWLTAWRAGNKPRVAVGQVALVYRHDEDVAEAVTIAKINPPDGVIEVIPGEPSPHWHEWPKGEAVLKVAPRWKRKCWLNGGEAIRTKAPHGLAAGSYICWKGKDGSYSYATVLKADRQCLWLDTQKKRAQRPQPGTEIMVALPINTTVMSVELEAINKDAADVSTKNEEMKLPPVESLPFTVYKPFQPKLPPPPPAPDTAGGTGLLPPASLPGLGSFLFPSPLLPIDLVKMAVEMLLSMGMMVIPSTGMPVFKGMPFGGSFDGAENINAAATALVEMLDNMILPAVWGDGGFLVDTQGTPVFLEATPELVQAVKSNENKQFVTIEGKRLDKRQIQVVNGKVRYVDRPVGQPVRLQEVGVQPHYTDLGLDEPEDNQRYALKMVAWEGSSPGQEPSQDIKKAKVASTIQNPVHNAAETAAAIFQSIQRNNTGTVNGALPEPLLAVLKGAPVVRGIVIPPEPAYVFDGLPEPVESGDWVVGEFEDRALRALHVTSIDSYDTGGTDKAFSLTFDQVPTDAGALKTVHAAFRAEIAAHEGGVNKTVLGNTVELDAVPDSLIPGRKVLLLAEGKRPVAAKVASVDGSIVTIDPAPAGYTAGDLIICGNVVEAGHGVAKPAVILGSGDAARTHQEFTLEVKGVSFTPDPTMLSGFAAAVEVEVSGRVWQQVSSLKDSRPGDHHYAVRMTEEGYIRFLFGDGWNGRRLPTGRNNVRVRYRVGCGLAGNLPPHSLEEAVNPHPLVKSVGQPAHAAGGGDMESTESLRTTAPATLLALERAVSLSDFSDLAKGRSNVWQAHARREVANSGRKEEVIVTIVPTGGTASDETLEDVRLFLEAHALPEVQVIVKRFSPATNFLLNILVRVNSSAHMPDDVVRAVIKTVVARFSLENRRLGAGLYLSEIYKAVEGVTGVENSVCLLTAAGKAVPVVNAENAQTVVYLDPANLHVHPEEYTP